MDEEPPSKISGTKLAQQALPSMRPIIRGRHAYVIFTFFALLFFALGIVQTLTVSKLQSVEKRYDDSCVDSVNCVLSFRIDSVLNPPIVLYYRLTNFYQNHRRYASSRSVEQLSGEYVVLDDLDSCDPLTNISETVLVPCGLSALTVFNDTFSIIEPTPLNFSEKGIAWESDLKSLFKPANEKYPVQSKWLEAMPQFPGGQINEHFVVWMRVNAISDVVKTYGRCDNCVVQPGEYRIQIENKYPTNLFNGEKWIGIREETAFGPKNSFLEILCYVYGAWCIACDLVIILVTLIRPRASGDPVLIKKLKEKAGALK
jgi:hypothetical protein